MHRNILIDQRKKPWWCPNVGEPSNAPPAAKRRKTGSVGKPSKEPPEDGAAAALEKARDLLLQSWHVGEDGIAAVDRAGVEEKGTLRAGVISALDCSGHPTQGCQGACCSLACWSWRCRVRDPAECCKLARLAPRAGGF